MNNLKSYKQKLIKTYQDLNNIDLNLIVEKLKNSKDTRHATISIYDGKEHEQYKKEIIAP